MHQVGINRTLPVLSQKALGKTDVKLADFTKKYKRLQNLFKFSISTKFVDRQIPR